MLTEERRHRIVDLLQAEKAVLVTELVTKFDASESTIRRDLAALDREGLLRKVHGGATVLDSAYLAEEDMPTKESKHVYEKECIGRKAASLIRDDDFVYVDAGTTTEKLVDALPQTKAVFVTNSILHARKLTLKGCVVYVIGGRFKLATEAIVGADGIESLQKYNFTKCFLGTNGVSGQGFTTPDMEEALLKRTAISHSMQSYVMADSSKQNHKSAVTFGELSRSVLITEQILDEELERTGRILLAETGVQQEHGNGGQ